MGGTGWAPRMGQDMRCDTGRDGMGAMGQDRTRQATRVGTRGDGTGAAGQYKIRGMGPCWRFETFFSFYACFIICISTLRVGEMFLITYSNFMFYEK